MSPIQFRLFGFQKSFLLESLHATINASAGSWGDVGQSARQVPCLTVNIRRVMLKWCAHQSCGDALLLCSVNNRNGLMSC